jgi:hypothetical protein
VRAKPFWYGFERMRHGTFDNKAADLLCFEGKPQKKKRFTALYISCIVLFLVAVGGVVLPIDKAIENKKSAACPVSHRGGEAAL